MAPFPFWVRVPFTLCPVLVPSCPVLALSLFGPVPSRPVRSGSAGLAWSACPLACLLVCPSVSVCVFVFVSVPLRGSVSLSLSLSLYLSPSPCAPVPSRCLSACLHVCPSFCLCLPACLHFCPSVCLSAFPLAWLSVSRFSRPSRVFVRLHEKER